MAKDKKKNILTGFNINSSNQSSSSFGQSGSNQSSSSAAWNTSYVDNATTKALKKAEKSYKSPYALYLSTALDDIQTQQPFQYDMNKDALYKQYAEQYKNLGQQAMEDTMANASTLSGGYGNSYAATAGQQSYQAYLNQLNDKVPELYAQARQAYDSKKNEAYNQAQLYANLDSEAYNRYAQNREYYANKYNNEWNRNAVQHQVQNSSSNSWERQQQNQTSNQTSSNYIPASYMAYQSALSAAKAGSKSGSGKTTTSSNGKLPQMKPEDYQYYQNAVNWLGNNGYGQYRDGLMTFQEYMNYQKANNKNYKYTDQEYPKYVQEVLEGIRSGQTVKKKSKKK